MAKANKTQITEVSVADFIDVLPIAARQDEAKVIAALMEAVTGQAPKMWGPSIIGFGNDRYKYESGREGETPRVAFSPRKPQLVFYGLGVASFGAAHLERLGKHTCGKGCLYVKKLSDIDLGILKEMVALGWQIGPSAGE